MNTFTEEPGKCPQCQYQGVDVSYDTVLSLAYEFVKSRLNYSQFYLCTNPICNVAYFSNNQKIMVNDIKVPIWFKNTKEKYIVCYCRDITLDDVINIIKEENELTAEQIIKILKKENVPTNCILHMPTGESCDRLFHRAVEYAKRLVLNQKNN
ncbi:MAG: hypothetical protein M0R05_00215 [Bacilli bacterium]|nr:hypothetical protein [Bacilli bacterium]MDD4076592.1 hypothetical protein [Bacilli bacterium]MDD4387709.1 hypothetical protein [Bacilli bacterium]